MMEFLAAGITAVACAVLFGRIMASLSARARRRGGEVLWK